MARYKKNDLYFNEPTIDNCFVAGFIAADGCITQHPRRGTMLSIKVTLTDNAILEHVKNSIQYEGVIHDHTPKIGRLQQELKISASQKYAIDLEKHFNITPRKSLTLSGPNITEEDHIKSFICGYFEGDGCLTYNYKRLVIDFCCSKLFSDWLYEAIKQYTGVSSSIVFQNNTYHVKYSGNKARIVHDWMKSNKIKILQRKWERKYDKSI